MKQYFSLVKFSHTIFALPFALLGFFLAVNRTGAAFSLRLFALVLLCMVFARSAAMAFNRYLDRDIDKIKPRTAVREIPSGIISPRSALFFVVLSSAFFMLSAWFINALCFMLSPVALLIILGYSYTKRFTWLCHFVLGLGLSLAPIGAYLAGGGGFCLVPLFYLGAGVFWGAGFDIIYGLQDEDFDRSHRLNSVPVAFGKKGGLRLSEWCHLLTVLFMLAAGFVLQNNYPQISAIHWVAVAVFLSLLFYQHTIVKPDDLSKVNLAFFTTNGVASLVFGALVIADFYF